MSIEISEKPESSSYKGSYYRKFIFYFIVFGALTSLITAEINYRIKISEMRGDLETESRNRANFLQNQLREMILNSEANLRAIGKNRLFREYLQNKTQTAKSVVLELFQAIGSAIPEVAELRYVNEDNETIFDATVTPADLGTVSGEKIAEWKKAVWGLHPGEFWHSRIGPDLITGKSTKERAIMEIATPVYQNSNYRGFLLIKLTIKRVFEDFDNYNNFLVYIADKDGEFLIHPDARYSWSRYMQGQQKVSGEFPEYFRDILENENYVGKFVYSYSLEDPVQNREGLKLILRTKPELIKKTRIMIFKSAIRLMMIMIFLSLPLSLLAALVPSRLQNRLSALVSELQKISERDGLTGIYNRMKTEEILRYEMERSRRFSSELGIIMIDIDFFKSVNDNHGHNAGDKTLREFAEILKTTLRKSDTIGRWGGEEFLVICPETNIEHLGEVAEKVRARVAAHTFPAERQMTVSQGIAQYISGDNIENFIKRADVALYSAKEAGRNRVGIGA